MFRIWTERQIPAAVKPMIGAEVRLLGPGTATPNDPTSDLGTAQGVIAGGAAKYDARFMAKAPDLRVIARTGIGIDNVDVAEATSRSIVVCNTPDGPTVSTAEHAITLMLNAAKLVKRYDLALRESDERDFVSGYNGIEMDGLSLGLVGLARIGPRVAAIPPALGMPVSPYDPSIESDRAEAWGITLAPPRKDMLPSSDVVPPHFPLPPRTPPP